MITDALRFLEVSVYKGGARVFGVRGRWESEGIKERRGGNESGGDFPFPVGSAEFEGRGKRRGGFL